MQELSALSLRNFTRALRQRWWLALGVTLALFAGIATLVYSLPPAYTARAVVLLAPPRDELSESASAGRGAPMTDPFFIRSETAIIGSDDLSRTVIRVLGLTGKPEFAPAAGVPGRHPYLSSDEVAIDAVLRDYQERLSVFNDGRSKTVEIGFTAGDPRLAAAIANAHAEAYLGEQAARRSDRERKSLEWLKQEVDARAREARDADALVQQYQLQNGIVSTQAVTMVEQRLGQVSSQLVDARRQLSTQQAMVAEIRALRAGGNPANAATLVSNEPLQQLLRDRVLAEAQVASLETRLAAGHPTLIKQRQNLASINEVLGTQLSRVEREAEATMNAWQRQVSDLSRTVASETASKVSQDRASAALPALLAEAQVKRTVLETVLNRYQMRLAEHGYSEPAAAIVSRAMPPARPSFPRTSLFLVVGFMVAAMGGMAAALALHLLRPRLLSLSALADSVGLRPLVAVPRFRNDAGEGGVVEIRDPKLYIESIRSLRHALFELKSTRETKVCLFTSVVPVQGKTVVAMSVARALARAGVRTLFLEMDLRCPAASKLARLGDCKRGVAAVLEGHTAINDVLERDAATGLDMLLAENNAAHSLDKLTVQSFAGLIARLRQKYEAIIVDSPPAGLLSDASTLACVADQTVIVARNGQTSAAELTSAVRFLRDRGATLAGLVLTHVDPADLDFADESMSRYVMGMPGKVAPLPHIQRAR
jgi:capsular exopolysaccharide synthesis family protein